MAIEQSAIARERASSKFYAGRVYILRMLRNNKVCPNCGVADIRPSGHRNFFEKLLFFVFIVPYRCRICLRRFYRSIF
jgi:hypothetical protein